MQPAPSRSMTALVLVLLLVVAACGSDEVGDRTTDDASPRDTPTYEELAEQDEIFATSAELTEVRAQVLTDRLGEEGALDAVLLAFERGYGVEQLDDAIQAETLDGDGTIEDVEPEGDRLGIIELPEGGVGTADRLGPHSLRRPRSVQLPSGLHGWDVPIPLDEMRDQAETTFASTPGDQALVNAIGGLTVILRLTESGYTPDQIVEAALSGHRLGTGLFAKDDRTDDRFDVRICDYLRDDAGDFVLPAGRTTRARQCSLAMQDFEFRDLSEALAGRAPSGDDGVADGRAADEGDSEANADATGLVAVSDVAWTDPEGNVLPGDQFMRVDLCPDGRVQVSGRYTDEAVSATASGSGTWDPAVGTGTVEYSLAISGGESSSGEVEFTIDEVGEYLVLPGIDTGTTSKLSITADEPDC